MVQINFVKPHATKPMHLDYVNMVGGVMAMQILQVIVSRTIAMFIVNHFSSKKLLAENKYKSEFEVGLQ